MKNSEIFENNFFSTYYYSNIISNILTGDADTIGFLSNFREYMGSSVFLAYQKESALHHFCRSVIGDFLHEDMTTYDEYDWKCCKLNSYFKFRPYIDSAFSVFELDWSFEEFLDGKSDPEFSDLEEYYEELLITGYFEEVVNRIADEVFYVIFNNRRLMSDFNYLVAGNLELYLDEDSDIDIGSLFTSKGTLKRARIPQWAKDAVFFRDKGKCTICLKDISSLLHSNAERHYDHMVSLAEGGLNDVSNLQLLCRSCNQTKGSKSSPPSLKYFKWY
ncbi:HNH endonuclease signature motif containing protein [Algoriphagus sp. NG3]|uniref:HNH endonuclease n=1 Tax=Algoriphagus sp. NG3 TaxID=3097546 RepID=UPI002A83D99A|nr:HNH endonuclease signature motif containing protein [Algoriphagus sp. NG3]WPR77703.1 HNH endonuclease signature motif containing protein [Algoriphagus sp. NG3]